MTLISKATLQFLRDIKLNNNRPWFEANKSRYLDTKKELEIFAETLMHGLMTFDKSLRDEPKPYVFRIYRDARFAKGRPYKNNLGILLLKGGRPLMHERAGYYLHLEPGQCFLAGGAYMPPPRWLGAIREDIFKNPKKLQSIIQSKPFTQFFQFDGEKLKTSPKGFSKDHPAIELLRHKDFMGIHHLSDKQVLDPAFLDHCVKVFKVLHPFNDYLNGLNQ